MKRFLALICTLVLGGTGVSAQEIGVSLSYQFLNAPEWNRSTRVYNFSRPFLETKQPLLRHGVRLGVYYLPRPDAAFAWGPAVSVALHQSAATNPNFDISIQSLLLDLGVKMQYRPGGADSDLFMALTPSITGVTLARRENGEVVYIGEPEEDWKLRSFGVGAGLLAEAGYDLGVGDQWRVRPTVGVGYHPYVWTYRSEVVFNEAAAGDLESATGMLRLQGGVAVGMRK